MGPACEPPPPRQGSACRKEAAQRESKLHLGSPTLQRGRCSACGHTGRGHRAANSKCIEGQGLGLSSLPGCPRAPQQLLGCAGGQAVLGHESKRRHLGKWPQEYSPHLKVIQRQLQAHRLSSLAPCRRRPHDILSFWSPVRSTPANFAGPGL